MYASLGRASAVIHLGQTIQLRHRLIKQLTQFKSEIGELPVPLSGHLRAITVYAFAV